MAAFEAEIVMQARSQAGWLGQNDCCPRPDLLRGNRIEGLVLWQKSERGLQGLGRYRRSEGSAFRMRRSEGVTRRGCAFTKRRMEVERQGSIRKCHRNGTCVEPRISRLVQAKPGDPPPKTARLADRT